MPAGRPAAPPPELPPSRSSWWKQAACLRHRHPEWFTSGCHHPGGATRGRGRLTVNAQRAIVVCSGCPVRQACLDEALLFVEQVGVWGGLTDQERRCLPAERASILRERYGAA
jgi:WhiB family redox-sensing transcriptional regulator